jgi:hypothetical protein
LYGLVRAEVPDDDVGAAVAALLTEDNHWINALLRQSGG